MTVSVIKTAKLFKNVRTSLQGACADGLEFRRDLGAENARDGGPEGALRSNLLRLSPRANLLWRNSRGLAREFPTTNWLLAPITAEAEASDEASV